MASPSGRGAKTSLNSTELTAAVRELEQSIQNVKQTKERKKYHILPPATPAPAISSSSSPFSPRSAHTTTVSGPIVVSGTSRVTPGDTPGNDSPSSPVEITLPFEALKGGIIIINESFTSDVIVNIVIPNDGSKMTGFYEIDARNDSKFNVTVKSVGDKKFIIDGVDIIGSNSGSRWYVDLFAKEITRLS